jgi:hypothetical protein
MHERVEKVQRKNRKNKWRTRREQGVKEGKWRRFLFLSLLKLTI